VTICFYSPPPPACVGDANLLDWVPSDNDPNAGTGKYGTCCTEMDIWEANKISSAYTPHTCSVVGQTRCGEGTDADCGDIDDNNPDSRYTPMFLFENKSKTGRHLL
jgi:cellulose 1,4-beta-cellobiosidase